MTNLECIEALKEFGAKHVYNHLLMNEDVYILKKRFPTEYQAKYHELKVMVSNQLNVPLKNVAIVGSAKTGYSLTPDKNFSEFSEKSDLDLVVVSSELFHKLWESHLQFRSSVMRGKKYSYSSVAKNIFRHFVDITEKDISTEMYEYFKEWIGLVGRLKKEMEQVFETPADLNYRIYDDWRYVEQYHVEGLQDLLKKVIENERN